MTRQRYKKVHKASRSDARRKVGLAEEQKAIQMKFATKLARIVKDAEKQGVEFSVSFNGKEANIEVDTAPKGFMKLTRRFARAVTKLGSTTTGAIVITGVVVAASLGQSSVDAQAGYDKSAPQEMTLNQSDIELGRKMQEEALNARFGAIVGPMLNQAINTAVDTVRPPVRQAQAAPKSTIGAP